MANKSGYFTDQDGNKLLGATLGENVFLSDGTDLETKLNNIEYNTEAVRLNKSDFFATGTATDFDVFKIGKLIVVNRLSFTGVTCSQYASLATIKDEYKPNTNSLRLIATYPSGLNVMQITNSGFISETALNNQNVLLNSFSYIVR